MRTKTNGFTLIELLVVIAIIAILAAMLFPVYAKAKNEAYQAECISNLKQLGIAWRKYADDWNGGACPSYYGTDDGIVCWDFSANADGWTYGLLAKYAKSAELHSCPSYKLPAKYSPDHRPYTGYAYNATYIGGDWNIDTKEAYLDPVSGEPRTPCKLSEIKRPSKTAVFADAGYGDPVTPHNYLRAPSDKRWYDAGTVHFRHEGCAVVAYADGRVEATNKKYLVKDNVPECGALSPDDSAYDLE